MLLSIVSIGHAQENVGKKVVNNSKEQTTNRVEQEASETVDKTLDKISEGIDGLFKKKGKKEKDSKNKSGSGSDTTGAASQAGDDVNANKSNTRGASSSQSQSLQMYSKFDFVPGEQVIAYEDFSEANIGDFPLEWNTNSSAEVVRLGEEDTKWLFMSKDGFFQPMFITDMPENFTIEFDAFTRYRSSNILGYQFQITSSQNPRLELGEEYTTNYIQLNWAACEGSTGFYVVENGEVVSKNEGFMVKELACEGDEYSSPSEVRFSIWRQKNRLRVYANATKILDIPQAFNSNLNYNVFKFGTKYVNYSETENKDEFMVSNIRYAVGAADTRSKLITEGKLVTRGILFDSGSDVINPSSYGVLKDIATVLKENPEVNIKVLGHTDSDGEADTNLILSQKRALAVKMMLAKEFSIPESRMQTDGLGESEPSDSNATPAGKANNRRVEFIKL